MFPTAGSNIYRNEAGEVTGWDSSYDDGPDPDDYYSFTERFNPPADEPDYCKGCGEEDCPGAIDFRDCENDARGDAEKGQFSQAD